MTEDSLRILLVESGALESESTALLLGQVFGSTCEVRVETTLKAAVRVLTQDPVDVVLLDLSLRDSQGWATLWQVHEAAPDVALVVLTGCMDDAIGLDAIRRGAQDFLFKGLMDGVVIERAVRYAVERKRFERELKHYQEHLQELVDEATRDLIDANDQLHREIRERKGVETRLREVLAELERLSEAKSMFVSNVSHELKTPLASIAHALENLLVGVVGPVPPRIRDYLLMMQEDSRRLRITVDDILDLTRLEANRLVLNRVTLRLGRFAGQAVAALRLQAAEKHQRLELRDSGRMLFVSCDPPKMQRVLLNVLANAVKFTPAGGHILLTVGEDAEARDQWAVVTCRDNGVGIPEEHLPQITQRYYRVGEHVDGTGLGLALSKELVDLHGGALTVMSPPRGETKGTLVSIRLPRERPPLVLSVEDHEAVRTMLRVQLLAAGYRSMECASAEQALDLLALPERPNLMIVDLRLPGMNGLDLVAQIKSVPEWRYLPIVVVTGRELDPETGGKLADFGVPVLAKPWKWNELIEQLDDSALGKHYLRF